MIFLFWLACSGEEAPNAGCEQACELSEQSCRAQCVSEALDFSAKECVEHDSRVVTSLSGFVGSSPAPFKLSVLCVDGQLDGGCVIGCGAELLVCTQQCREKIGDERLNTCINTCLDSDYTCLMQCPPAGECGICELQTADCFDGCAL